MTKGIMVTIRNRDKMFVDTTVNLVVALSANT